MKTDMGINEGLHQFRKIEIKVARVLYAHWHELLNRPNADQESNVTAKRGILDLEKKYPKEELIKGLDCDIIEQLKEITCI